MFNHIKSDAIVGSVAGKMQCYECGSRQGIPVKPWEILIALDYRFAGKSGVSSEH